MFQNYSNYITSTSGVFRRGCAIVPYLGWPRIFGDSDNTFFPEFLPSRFNDVTGPMEVRPLSQIQDTLLTSTTVE
jgi:hypothetical protein